VSGHCERLPGWSCGFTPPKEDCRLPPTYFWTTWHQTRAFLISLKNENLINGLLDNSEKGDVSGQLERLRGWSCGGTTPRESCQLPPSYFWTTCHQARAFLIPVNKRKWYSGWFDNPKKGDVSGQSERLRGWSRGYTPPQERCRLTPTYLYSTWQQTRASLISVKNKKWCGMLVWQFWKRRCVWEF